MSISSDSSICGDEDGDLLFEEEEEIDFYAILNVPKDATDDEIIKAYRKRCLMFHPDRFTDNNEKKDAERVFVKLRRAHEVLLDPKQRAIYDALGIQGLDTQGWELVSRSANPENIRKEYEFLQRLKDRELMLQRVHPTSTFMVKTTVAGMFQENEEDRYPPQLLGISLSQSVDCAFTGVDRFGLSGRVKTGNGRGDGSVTAVWKRVAGNFNLENTVSLSSESVSLTCRAARNVFTRAAIIVQPQLQYNMLHEAFIPSIAMIYSMRLHTRWQGSIVLNISPIANALTTTMVHTENNHAKAVGSLTLSPVNSNVRMSYFIRKPENDSVTEMSIQLTTYGVSPAISMDRRLSRYSRVSCSFHFSFPSCLLYTKFKLKAGQSTFDWQIVLCDDKEALSRSVLYGVAVPYFTFQLAKIVFRPWWERFKLMFEDNSREQEVDVAKKEEAANIVNLMRATAERIKRDEESKQGVIIESARYGQCDVSGTTAYPLAGERTIDVTVPLQAMVNDSQLRVYTIKSQLPGFYDPCPGDPKMLTVRYVFRGEEHSCTVADEMPLMLPLRAEFFVIAERRITV
ncbi:CRE-DNJ-9 protein [Caenorhabditis remanei]|uniref:CRE-DNJ-9 protein n=1 Tax=Caenorhabditis remanei TaxID=31234 RepID=E3M481_CAERE|nr:CRE-DNJ-9 protein [Caenorhabditis remanei]